MTPIATGATARDRAMAVVETDRAIRAAIAAVPVAPKALGNGAHEATQRTRQRRLANDYGSADNVVHMDARQLRISARDRDRNHDVSRNALNVLVQNTVGSGIDVMPAPRRSGEQVDVAIAQTLRDLWDEWWDRPEVTWQHDFGKCQQLLARSMYRDGESFFQALVGPVNFLDHGTKVPLSIEMFESDLIPLDYEDPKRNISQGIETNAWKRRLAYWVYKQHPGDARSYNIELKRVPADQIYQVALLDRIHQTRGLSIFASVMNRLIDIQDYEDSERIAAKVAASLCAQIIKGDPAQYGEAMNNAANAAASLDSLANAYRSLRMVPGMIGDDLIPGERVEVIDSNRPNPNAAAFVDAQLRRAAGGFGTSFSSLSMNYNGTYSAQRQELIEKWGAYAMLGEQFIARVMRPVWSQFVYAATLSGALKVPRGWSMRELSAAVYVRPQMPWIDPLKEALARAELEDRGWQAPQQSILQTGNDPEDVQRLREDWAARTANTPAPVTAPQDPNTFNGRRAALRAHALQDKSE